MLTGFRTVSYISLMHKQHREHFIAALLVCLMVLAAWPAPARGRVLVMDGANNAGSLPPVLSGLDGRVVDTVLIDNRNIFDTDKPRYDNFLFRAANKLHIVTRQSTIRREVLLEAGEPFSAELAEETARNLRSRYQVFDAWIEAEELPDGKVKVTVVTVDQWSLIGGVTLRDRGDRTDLEFGFEERNLLGYNQFLDADYVVRENRLNYFRAGYRDDRVRGERVQVRLDFNDNPEDRFKQVIVGRPYYDLSQQTFFSLALVKSDRQRDQYQDSLLVARSRSQGDAVQLALGQRWGGYHRKFRVWGEYRYRFVGTTNKDTLVMNVTEPIVFAGDSVHHDFELVAAYDILEFARFRRLNGFNHIEDITLGLHLGMGYTRAFVPTFDEYLFDRFWWETSYTANFGSWLLSGAFTQYHWFRGGTEFRRTRDLVFRAYNTALEYLTVAARAVYEEDRLPEGYSTLVLGGLGGLRGFNEYHATGERLGILNIEARVFPGLEILAVAVGGAVFADLGRTWKPDEGIAFDHLSHSLGVGLRFSLEKLVKSELIRIDLARLSGGGWELSVDTGQFF